MFIKLKEQRKKHNYTFADMGKMLNISKAYYWQIEHCKRRLNYELAIKIAQIFNLTPDEMFYEDFKQNKKA